MKKIIIGIIALLILGGATTAYFIYNKPHQDIASANVDYSLNAKDLYAEYDKDEQKADKKYLDKILKVKGKVADIKKDSVVTIMLESGAMMGLVACEMDEFSEHKEIKVEHGETVTIKGILTGKLIDVVLVRCIILNQNQ